MATAAQLNANRENAQHSTGPRTAEGKESSSRNALKHGFNAKRLIIRDDEQEEFLELRDRLAGEFKLRTAHMWFLFEQLIHAAWNMKRIQRAEAELFESGVDPLLNPDCTAQLQLFSRYYARHERSYQRFLHELRDYQTTVVTNCNAIPPLQWPQTPPLSDTKTVLRCYDAAREVFPDHVFKLKPEPADYEPSAAPKYPTP